MDDNQFVSMKNEIAKKISKVPLKFRHQVSSKQKTDEQLKKYMLDKGLIGKSGQIDKTVQQIQMIEQRALDRIEKNYRAQLWKEPEKMTEAKEMLKDLKKERLQRSIDADLTKSTHLMSKIQKENDKTELELERISRIEDPVQMYQEKKEENKAKYEKLKHKIAASHLGDGPLGALRSPVSHDLVDTNVF